MKTAIIGAGPAGSYFAYQLASQKIETTIFHLSDENEKPCGGGMTCRALKEFDIIREIEKNANSVTRVKIFSPSDREAEFHLVEPIRIFSRLDLDSFLRARAKESGAHFVRGKVIDFTGGDEGWTIQTEKGTFGPFELLVGADGASSSIRKKLAKPFHEKELTQTTGFFINDASDDCIKLKFYEDMEGYAWSFPRKTNINIGIGTPLGTKKPQELRQRVQDFIERYLPDFTNNEKESYSALIPFANPEGGNLTTISGKNWALIGDSSGITDSITREGIYYALKTASFLGEALKDGGLHRYPSLVKNAFEEDMVWAYRNKNRFFRKEFIDSAVEACNESKEISSVVADLLSGNLCYRDLVSRMFSIAFKVDMALMGRLLSHLT